MTGPPSARCVSLLLLIAILWLGLLVSCSEDGGSSPPLPPDQTVDQLVSTTGWFDEVVRDSTAFSQVRFDSTGVDGGLDCTDRAGHLRRVVDRLTTLAPDAEAHRAGAILQFGSIQQAVPDLVVGPRAGGTIELQVGAGNIVSDELTVLDAASVEAWRVAALDGVPSVAGTWELEAAALWSAGQIAVSAGLFPSAFPSEVEERLAPLNQGHGAALLRLQRTHHTVRCPYPGRAGDTFQSTVTGPDLTDQMSEGNPPAWVHEAEHGQLLLVLIEAAAPVETVVDAALNTFVAAATGSAPAAGRPVLDDLAELSVMVHAVAADAATVEEAALAGVDDLAAVLAEPVADIAALPAVTVGLQALRNGGPLLLGPECDYSFTTCEPYTAVFDQVLWSLDAADARTERLDGDLEVLGEGSYYYHGGSDAYTYDHVVGVPDLRGQGVSSVPDQAGLKPILHHELANGRPAMELFEMQLPEGDIYSQMGIDGTPFVGQEYTLFMVVGLPDIIRLTVVAEPEDWGVIRSNRPSYIVHGSGNGPRDNLIIGYGRDSMVYGHGRYYMVAPHDIPHGWHVYAFSFGFDRGMTIYMDGEELMQEHWDYSLNGFAGATICTRWRGEDSVGHAVLWLAEAVAYRGEASVAEVQAETARLWEKYGF